MAGFHDLKNAWRRRALPLKAASFALVGLINFAVDLGIFSLAYYRFALAIITSNILAWLVAVTGSYVLNTKITFARESGKELRLRHYGTFALSQTGGLIANTAAVFALSYFVPVLLAKVVAIGASFLVNFSLSNFLVFRATGVDDAARR